MKFFDQRYWVRTTVAAAVVGGIVFGAMRLANAVPGGETRSALSFAGTLTGATGPQMLTFTFKKGTTTICAPSVTVTPGSSGQFVAEIPTTSCPSSLFDGSDVVFDVAVGSTIVARDQAVNPVPYAQYANRLGSADCPVGYDRDSTASGIVLCRRALAGGAFDDVVKVGNGATAFWIDRFEGSVWQNADGSGTQFGTLPISTYPATFPANGQASAPAFAFSRSSVAPSTGITWFQADAACHATGKRLATGPEWLMAARGTPDPGVSTGAAGSCVTMGSAPRVTGGGTACLSVWGAQDMIGNLWELTGEWYAGAGSSAPTSPATWGPDSLYTADGSWNVNGFVINGPTTVTGTPAAAQRGGSYQVGPSAGVFAFNLIHGAPDAEDAVGFRCVIPR